MSCKRKNTTGTHPYSFSVFPKEYFFFLKMLARELFTKSSSIFRQSSLGATVFTTSFRTFPEMKLRHDLFELLRLEAPNTEGAAWAQGMDWLLAGCKQVISAWGCVQVVNWSPAACVVFLLFFVCVASFVADFLLLLAVIFLIETSDILIFLNFF